MAMKYKYGDRVNFLNDTGGGIVNRVDDRGYVYVLTEDGFEIPVPEKELVFSRNFAFADSEDDTIIKAPASTPTVKVTDTIEEKPVKVSELPRNIPADTPVHLILGFIPESPGLVFTSKLDCYLINDSAFFTYYLLGKKEGGGFHYLSSGFIEAETFS
jgi:hypothetical protein